jgi:hypothetical protein
LLSWEGSVPLTFKLAPFNIENIIFLCCNTSYLIEVVNCTEPSPSVSFPWLRPQCIVSADQEKGRFRLYPELESGQEEEEEEEGGGVLGDVG